MTKLTSGQSATVALNAFSSITINLGRPAGAGSMTLTSLAQALQSNLTLNPLQSRTYGPFGVPMTAIITCADGSMQYTCNAGQGEPAMGSQYQPILTPTGFTWTTYPFKLYRHRNGTIATDFDITTLIPAITNTWYVDPVNGNDGTAAVNNRNLPLLNLATALAKNPCDQVRIINLTADFIGRTTKSWNNVQPAVSMSVVVEGNFRYISGKFASATVPTWIVNPSFANVYKTTIASASAAQVIDTSVKVQPSYADNNGGSFFTACQRPPPSDIRPSSRYASRPASI